MKAPQIDHLLRCLRDGNVVVTKETEEIIDRIFVFLKQVAPCGDDERRELWIRAERGTIDDFGKCEEFIEDEIVGTNEEFQSLWQEEYPDEESWYLLQTAEYRESRAIAIGRRVIWWSDNQKSPFRFQEDLTGLFSWALSAAEQSAARLKDGTYNEDVERNLPAKHRTGTIKRKDFWKLFPEYKTDYFDGVSGEEVQEFLKNAAEQKDDVSAPPVGEYLPQLSAGQFYAFCAMGYEANGYERAKGLTPKEQYYRMADRRDEGLSELDENDPEAFEDWLLDRKRFGGHPWEVCTGGNSTHIDLWVIKDENGYSLGLAGKSYGRSIETMRFYNALRRSGVAVYLFDAKELAARFTESDLIGIVPEGIYPVYCENMFPGMKILDFMNLPYDREEIMKMLPYISWLPETEQYLLGEEPS